MTEHGHSRSSSERVNENEAGPLWKSAGELAGRRGIGSFPWAVLFNGRDEPIVSLDLQTGPPRA